MAELTHRERLQPSLLDRLTDESPETAAESRDRRVLSLQRLREVVRRDLSWLLNCVHMEASEDLSAWPLVARSTLNYGIPDTAGTLLSSVDVEQLQKRVRQAILDFEPRLMRRSLRVEVESHDAEMGRKSLVFLIEGEMWAQPMPIGMYMRTELDLETGTVTLEEGRR
jgi:type VI secretion system protein ImpF